MRLIALAAAIVAFAAWIASGDSGTALFLWATERQRDFQNAMAGALQAIRAGDTVWIPPGVKHWHGASSVTAMAHIAIAESVDGSPVAWLEQVDDSQYSGR